jgi:integrase
MLPRASGVLRGAATAAGLLAVLVAMATFRFTAAWMMTLPLLLAVLYASHGERYQIEVTEDEVVLRRLLWPLPSRELRLRRDELKAVLLEEYDGEARLLFETETGHRHPLTEAFYRDLIAMHALREEAEGLLFPERKLLTEGSVNAGLQDGQ